jgi:hypothetical protein
MPPKKKIKIFGPIETFQTILLWKNISQGNRHQPWLNFKDPEMRSIPKKSDKMSDKVFFACVNLWNDFWIHPTTNFYNLYPVITLSYY